MPEQQPLRICVICIHKARSLQDNREREKKEERGNRQLLVESWNRWEFFCFFVFFTDQATVATNWMKRDCWDTHMRAGAHQLHNIDQIPVYLPLKHGDKRDKN